MDGTLGSGTALMLDGTGVRITSGEELAADHSRRRRGRVPGRGARDRRRSEPRGARRIRDDPRALAAARAPSPDRARPTPRAGRPAAIRRPRRRLLGAVLARTLGSRSLADRFWSGKTAGAYAYRSLVDSGAVVANGSDAPIEELDPLAGVRAGVRRTIDAREPWHPEQTLTVQQAFEATLPRPGVALRRRALARPADPRPCRRSRRARP